MNRLLERINQKTMLRVIKIAFGSCVAIYIAEYFQLQFAVAAGSITLLTVVTTKWQTVRLSGWRVATFLISGVIAWWVFQWVDSEWLAYGLYILIVAAISEVMGWGATISVNAVIGTHFLTTMDFTPAFIKNEFYLVLIGISIALILNLFNGNIRHKQKIENGMRDVEKGLQEVLQELAGYLRKQEISEDVWERLKSLEREICSFVEEAREYQENTFQFHPQYYISYFEMRLNQCRVLDSLHAEIMRIRNMPVQAEVIADYMLYLKKYVIEINEPSEQLKRLYDIFDGMKTQPLPVCREEFENRALLYHVLMDIEQFLEYKAKFVETLDEKQLKTYWKRTKS